MYLRLLYYNYNVVLLAEHYILLCFCCYCERSIVSVMVGALC